MFPEALMLHYLDDLDSKMESMRAHFEREAAHEGPWTGYNGSLGRPLLNSTKFMAPPEPTQAPEAPAQATANAAPGVTPTLPGFEPEDRREDAVAAAAAPSTPVTSR
jgi:3'-5' exoribonuclease